MFSLNRIHIILFLLFLNNGWAQDNSRGQFPRLLSNSFIHVMPGYIHYPFTQDHLEPGRTIEEIKIRHGAARIVLGHEFSEYISLQFGVMRPVKWTEFYGWDGSTKGRGTAWINIWSLSGMLSLPLTDKLSAYGEVGLSSLSRNGFDYRGSPMIRDANYLDIMCGLGANYKLSDTWDASINFSYLPPRKSERQPYTYLISLGAKYNLRKLSDDKVAIHNNSEFYFPKQFIQAGFAHDFIGYKVNSWFVWTEQSKAGIPIFWEGDVLTKNGFTCSYQRNVYHGKKIFSLDWGGSFSFWKSQQNNTSIVALSVFPLLRFWYFRRPLFDMYFNYSVAGPSFITPVLIDGYDTGKHFTFQDFLGVGVFLGKHRKLNAELKIIHYSNGGMFASNPGVDVPLMLNFGYAF